MAEEKVRTQYGAPVRLHTFLIQVSEVNDFHRANININGLSMRFPLIKVSVHQQCSYYTSRTIGSHFKRSVCVVNELLIRFAGGLPSKETAVKL